MPKILVYFNSPSWATSKPLATGHTCCCDGFILQSQVIVLNCIVRDARVHRDISGKGDFVGQEQETNTIYSSNINISNTLYNSNYL